MGYSLLASFLYSSTCLFAHIRFVITYFFPCASSSESRWLLQCLICRKIYMHCEAFQSIDNSCIKQLSPLRISNRSSLTRWVNFHSEKQTYPVPSFVRSANMQVYQQVFADARLQESFNLCTWLRSGKNWKFCHDFKKCDQMHFWKIAELHTERKPTVSLEHYDYNIYLYLKYSTVAFKSSIKYVQTCKKESFK